MNRISTEFINASNLDNTRQVTTGFVQVVDEAGQRDSDEIVSLPQTADLHVIHGATQHKVSTTPHMQHNVITAIVIATTTFTVLLS